MALQFLFQLEFQQGHPPDESLHFFRTSSQASSGIWEYVETLVQGVQAHKADVDKSLVAASAQWKLERMSHIDRNVMRIAIFEMLYSADLIPAKIAINEAVEISRRFGGSDSASFVNGVLDQIARTGHSA
jgi:N utilization substance protein B